MRRTSRVNVTMLATAVVLAPNSAAMAGITSRKIVKSNAVDAGFLQEFERAFRRFGRRDVDVVDLAFQKRIAHATAYETGKRAVRRQRLQHGLRFRRRHPGLGFHLPGWLHVTASPASIEEGFAEIPQHPCRRPPDVSISIGNRIVVGGSTTV